VGVKQVMERGETVGETHQGTAAPAAVGAGRAVKLPADAGCSTCAQRALRGRGRAKGRAWFCLAQKHFVSSDGQACAQWSRSPRSWGDVRLLRCLLEWRESHDYPPSLAELCLRLGWRSKSTVYFAIQRLADAGYVQYRPRESRTLVCLCLPTDYPSDWSTVLMPEPPAPRRCGPPPRPFEDWEKGVICEVGNGSIGELRLLFPRRTLREIRELAALCGVKLVSS
jgi:hypothetical protein